jgi:hypothetical protein
VVGSPVHIWEKNIKRVKVAIKDWVKTYVTTPQVVVVESKRQLEEMQDNMDSKEVNENSLHREQVVFHKYVKSLKDEETIWRLKSRSLWLQVGDKNTTFFHKQAKVRQWRNRVEEIKLQSGKSFPL